MNHDAMLELNPRNIYVNLCKLISKQGIGIIIYILVCERKKSQVQNKYLNNNLYTVRRFAQHSFGFLCFASEIIRFTKKI